MDSMFDVSALVRHLRCFLLQHLHIFACFRQNASFRLSLNIRYAGTSAITDFNCRTIGRYDAAQFHNPMIYLISSPSCCREIERESRRRKENGMNLRYKCEHFREISYFQLHCVWLAVDRPASWIHLSLYWLPHWSASSICNLNF